MLFRSLFGCHEVVILQKRSWQSAVSINSSGHMSLAAVVMQFGAFISLSLSACLMAAAQKPVSSSSGSLPAMNPVMTVQQLIPQQITSEVANGYFQLTPNQCLANSSATANKPPGGGASTRSSDRASSPTSTAICSGFRISNNASFATAVNAARFNPADDSVVIDPFNPQLYKIGTLNLTNKGFQQPTGAGMTVVTINGLINFNTPLFNKPTNVPIKFQVMWSLGSPASPNSAGLFVLVTRNPAPQYSFKVSMSQQIDFNMSLKLVGFVADPELGKNVQVLGDWGQPNPKAGEPGPRVFVKAGPTQVVTLYGLIQNTDNNKLTGAGSNR